jgi:hypothetical protein
MNLANCFTTLRSPAGNEVALTPALFPWDRAQARHWNGRGNFSILRMTDAVAFSYPSPLAGEGRVRVPKSFRLLVDWLNVYLSTITDSLQKGVTVHPPT